MPKKKQILFVHQNFPGQFKSLAPALIKEGYDVHALGFKDNVDNVDPYPGLTLHSYQIDKGTSEDIEPLAKEFETKMIRGKNAANKCDELKAKGFEPSLIISHPQWGETFFMKEIWPDAKFLSYFEIHWGNNKDSDVNFDKEFYNEEFSRFTERKLVPRNAYNEYIYMKSDRILTPTEFQKSTAPDYLQKRIKVIHDGINTNIIKPSNDVEVNISDNIKLTKKDKIISFVNRTLEPQRGYHIFMRSLPKILKEDSEVNVLIIGGNERGYGLEPPVGKKWQNIFYDEVKDDLDQSRVHFLGRIEYKAFLAILQVTTLHVYLTYPFVLSWSLLEAMASESLILASRTAPVTEVIENNKNGLLIDFFDIKGLSNIALDVLNNSDKYNDIRKQGRKTIINKYDLKKKCLPEQIKLVKEMLSK